MSEQAVPTETTENLVNLQPEPEAQEQQEAPIQIRPTEDQEDASFNDADTEPMDRPDYYPEKFWDEDGPDVEKLAKSYAELEKAFKSGKHKAPEGDYEVQDLVDRGLDLEDPTVQAYQDWAKKYGISQKAFEELAGKVLESSQENQEAIDYDYNQEMEKLGERAAEKISFLERHITKANLNQAEREALAISLNSADTINAMTKFIQGYTNEGIPTAPVVAAPEMSENDLAQAIADPRWQTDHAWRSKIERQWLAANN